MILQGTPGDGKQFVITNVSSEKPFKGSRHPVSACDSSAPAQTHTDLSIPLNWNGHSQVHRRMGTQVNRPVVNPERSTAFRDCPVL